MIERVISNSRRYELDVAEESREWIISNGMRYELDVGEESRERGLY